MINKIGQPQDPLHLQSHDPSEGNAYYDVLLIFISVSQMFIAITWDNIYQKTWLRHFGQKYCQAGVIEGSKPKSWFLHFWNGTIPVPVLELKILKKLFRFLFLLKYWFWFQLSITINSATGTFRDGILWFSVGKAWPRSDWGRVRPGPRLLGLKNFRYESVLDPTGRRTCPNICPKLSEVWNCPDVRVCPNVRKSKTDRMSESVRGCPKVR
jgi:hypothetical protein